MKSLVITTKSVGFLTPTGEAISAFYPAVVVESAFVDQRIASRELKLLGPVNDEATQAEFDKYAAESKDMKLAIASFLTNFAEPEEAAPADGGTGDDATGDADKTPADGDAAAGDGAPAAPPPASAPAPAPTKASKKS